jgi:hypothetical protein
MTDQIIDDVGIEILLKPETDLEQQILCAPNFRKGLLWGLPRYGHPEGQIVKHIQEVYENIEQLNIDVETRRKLRLVALIHDTFKYAEDRNNPRDWSKHHGILARQFAEDFIDDKNLLTIIELHDEAYFIWRLFALYAKPEIGEERLQKLLLQIYSNLELYFLFFKCDTQTGDKTQAPLIWFERIVAELKSVK